MAGIPILMYSLKYLSHSGVVNPVSPELIIFSTSCRYFTNCSLAFSSTLQDATNIRNSHSIGKPFDFQAERFTRHTLLEICSYSASSDAVVLSYSLFR